MGRRQKWLVQSLLSYNHIGQSHNHSNQKLNQQLASVMLNFCCNKVWSLIWDQKEN